jgi:hypothetical protein
LPHSFFSEGALSRDEVAAATAAYAYRNQWRLVLRLSADGCNIAAPFSTGAQSTKRFVPLLFSALEKTQFHRNPTAAIGYGNPNYFSN